MNPQIVAEASSTLSRISCTCGGAYDTKHRGQHFVWVAFLHYDNDEFRREQCARDYRFLPTNKLTCFFSGSDIFHCQMMFWLAREGRFETISVDASRGLVHTYKQKEFKRGWTFYRLSVEKWQENAIYLFCKAQVGKPINTLGINLLPIMPTSGRGEKWFCAELCTESLRYANLFWAEKPETIYPSRLRDLICDSHEVHFYESAHPVRFKRLRQAAGLEHGKVHGLLQHGAGSSVRSLSFATASSASSSVRSSSTPAALEAGVSEDD